MLILVCGGVTWLVREALNQDRFFETRTELYTNLDQAVQSGVVRLGWLPEFLPPSATNIREKHNFDYNRGIIAFEFTPSDFGAFATLLREVPPKEYQEIRPFWLYKRESWFPKVIVT